MSVKTGYCTAPCNGCPWRTDTAMSIDSEAAWKLCGSRDRPITPGEPMMPCHKKPTDGNDQNLCAAWLALYGWHHLGVRIMVASGMLPPDVLEIKPDWPLLHNDPDEIKEAHG